MYTVGLISSSRCERWSHDGHCQYKCQCHHYCLCTANLVANSDVMSTQVTNGTGKQLLSVNPKPTCKASSRAVNEGDEIMLRLLREGNEESNKAFDTDQALAQCALPPNTRRA